MSALLWVVAYLAVGFGVAVLWCRYGDDQDSVWPWVAVLLWLIAVPGLLNIFIRWCARRLP